jgi:hypothetical protein
MNNNLEHARVNDRAEIIGTPVPVQEKGKTMGIWTLEKFDVTKTGIIAPTPHEVLQFNNLLTNVGAQIIEDLLIGAGGTVFSNANAYIGIGNGTTATSAAHTDLQGASKTRKAMDATFPSRSSQTLTFRSTFATGDANYAWEEIAAFNAGAAGTMLNRALVSSPFTKTSALAVVATLTWTVS